MFIKMAYLYNITLHLPKKTFENIKNIQVISYEGLLAELYRETGVGAIVKGVRNMTDFVYEKDLYHKLKKSSKKESIFEQFKKGFKK